MPENPQPSIWRLRIKFGKKDALRYTGHLDLHKLWERTIRRAKLPLIHSQGFHPQPKIQIASALPLGYASQAELIDIWLEKNSDEIDLMEIQSTLQNAAPSGLEILQVETAEVNGKALQSLIRAAEYEVTLIDLQDSPALSEKLSAVLEAKTLPRERRKKAYDLRPLIEEMYSLPTDEHGHARLFLRLTTREGATGRVEEVLDEINIPLETAKIVRTHLIFQSD
jgi:radical SAM-linked protein